MMILTKELGLLILFYHFTSIHHHLLKLSFLLHLTLHFLVILIVCVYAEGGGGEWYDNVFLFLVLIISHFIFLLYFHVFLPTIQLREKGWGKLFNIFKKIIKPLK